MEIVIIDMRLLKLNLKGGNPQTEVLYKGVLLYLVWFLNYPPDLFKLMLCRYFE
jgi:hypothetical protein